METNSLPPGSQDWIAIMAYSTRSRDLKKLAPNKPLDYETKWITYGNYTRGKWPKSFPRRFYKVALEHFHSPIDSKEVDSAIERWKEKADTGVRIGTYYHCAD